MRYYVLYQGQQYGPADVGTLSQWAGEGRLLPSTTLMDIATGAKVQASQVPGILFPNTANPYSPAPAPNPYSQPYNPQVPGAQQTPYIPPGQQPGAGPQGQAPYVHNPYARTTYQRPGVWQTTSNELRTGWILTLLGFFCCPALSIGGLVLGVIAYRKGNSGAILLILAAVAALVFNFVMNRTLADLIAQ